MAGLFDMGEKSRRIPNQEWVLMYRRGLNQTRIARLVGAPVSKVGYHLTVARRLDPSLTVEHEALAAKVGARVNSSGLKSMNDLVAFVKSKGRYPSFTATSHEERRMATWLQRRRREAATDRLAEAYQEGMQGLPGWESRTRSTVDESRWQERLAALINFRANGEDWPRHKKTDSNEEHKRAVCRNLACEKFPALVIERPRSPTYGSFNLARTSRTTAKTGRGFTVPATSSASPSAPSAAPAFVPQPAPGSGEAAVPVVGALFMPALQR